MMNAETTNATTPTSRSPPSIMEIRPPIAPQPSMTVDGL